MTAMPRGDDAAFPSAVQSRSKTSSDAHTQQGRPPTRSDAPGKGDQVTSSFTAHTDQDLGEDPPFNWKLAVVATIAASAGSLFGYDLGLIGTITNVPGFTTFMNGGQRTPVVVEEPPSETFSLVDDPFCTGGGLGTGQFLTFTLFGGGIIGGALGSLFCPMFGRRATLVYAAAIFGLGVLLQGTAANVPMFYTARVIMGAGVGLTNQVAPIYLAEISPAGNRGAIGISFQFFITFGILLSTLVSFLFTSTYKTDEAFEASGTSYAWRFPVLIGLLPAMAVMFGGLCLTDTPQYIMGSKKEDAKALSYYLLAQLRQTEDVSREYNRMILYCDRRYTCLESWQIMFLDRRHIPPLLVTTALTVFQQITFLNGFLFFLPDLFVFGFTDLSEQTARLIASLTNSFVNFLATTIAIFIADRFGRRPLFMEAGGQLLIAACIMGALTFNYNPQESQDLVQVFITIVVVEVFVSAYAWSWGPLPWTMPAELNAWPWRSAGTSFAVMVNFAASMLVGGIFSSLLCQLKFILFILIAVIVIIATVLAYLLFPETHDVDLNETEFLFKGHWLWRRFYPEDERIEVLMRPGCDSCYKGGRDAEIAKLSNELHESGSVMPVPDYSSFTTAQPPPGLAITQPHISFPTLTDMYGVPESVRGDLTLTRSRLGLGTSLRTKSATPSQKGTSVSSKEDPSPPDLTPSSSGQVPITSFDSRASLRSAQCAIPE